MSSEKISIVDVSESQSSITPTAFDSAMDFKPPESVLHGGRDEGGRELYDSIKIGDEITIRRFKEGPNGEQIISESEGTVSSGTYFGLGGRIFLKGIKESPPISDIKKGDNVLFIDFGGGSKYEIRKKEEQDSQKILIQNHLKNIEQNIEEQPQSIKDLLDETRDIFSEIFVKVEKIGNKEFIFSGIQKDGKTVLALVKEGDSDRYKTVAFRFSNSDNQWKSLPGMRKDGTYLKGDESNSKHHYVQSAKLHPDIYMALDKLPSLPPENWEFDPEKYIPKMGSEGRYLEEFNFKENYLTLKSEWEHCQRIYQYYYMAYDQFVVKANNPRDYTLEGSFYLLVKVWEDFLKRQGVNDINNVFRKIQSNLESINQETEDTKNLKNTNLYQMIHLSGNEKYKKFGLEYDRVISEFISKRFKKDLMPNSMKPDFTASNCVKKYVKNPKGENPIHIEEYIVRSSDGNELIYSMARDSKNNIYIDNIYDPRVEVTEYGTFSEIVQMGLLVYKPEDYADQAEFGFPREYLAKSNSGDSDYININGLWRDIPVIKAYVEELEKRD